MHQMLNRFFLSSLEFGMARFICDFGYVFPYFIYLGQ